MIIFFEFLILLVIAGNCMLVFFVSAREPFNKTNQFFSWFVAFLTLFIVSVFFENRPDIVSYAGARLFLRVDFISSLFFFYTWMRFCEHFTGSSFAHARYIWWHRAGEWLLFLLSILVGASSFVIRDIGFE